MNANSKVDALRVATDPAYATSLAPSDWLALSQDPDWQRMVGEQAELVAPILAGFGDKTPGFADFQPRRVPGLAQVLAPPVIPLPGPPFSVIGKKVPRVQGLGVVTGLGQYTENMRMAGMLHTRTLRSPYPHAKVKAVDTKKAEALPGVLAILHRGNLPAEYKDTKLGSGPPDRFLFNEEVFEVGAPVAVVAAESEHIAEEAIHLIEGQYE